MYGGLLSINLKNWIEFAISEKLKRGTSMRFVQISRTDAFAIAVLTTSSMACASSFKGDIDVS